MERSEQLLIADLRKQVEKLTCFKQLTKDKMKAAAVKLASYRQDAINQKTCIEKLKDELKIKSAEDNANQILVEELNAEVKMWKEKFGMIDIMEQKHNVQLEKIKGELNHWKAKTEMLEMTLISERQQRSEESKVNATPNMNKEISLERRIDSPNSASLLSDNELSYHSSNDSMSTDEHVDELDGGNDAHFNEANSELTAKVNSNATTSAHSKAPGPASKKTIDVRRKKRELIDSFIQRVLSSITDNDFSRKEMDQFILNIIHNKNCIEYLVHEIIIALPAMTTATTDDDESGSLDRARSRASIFAQIVVRVLKSQAMKRRFTLSISSVHSRLVFAIFDQSEKTTLAIEGKRKSLCALHTFVFMQLNLRACSRMLVYDLIRENVTSMDIESLHEISSCWPNVMVDQGAASSTSSNHHLLLRVIRFLILQASATTCFALLGKHEEEDTEERLITACCSMIVDPSSTVSSVIMLQLDSVYFQEHIRSFELMALYQGQSWFVDTLTGWWKHHHHPKDRSTASSIVNLMYITGATQEQVPAELKNQIIPKIQSYLVPTTTTTIVAAVELDLAVSACWALLCFKETDIAIVHRWINSLQESQRNALPHDLLNLLRSRW